MYFKFIENMEKRGRDGELLLYEHHAKSKSNTPLSSFCNFVKSLLGLKIEYGRRGRKILKNCAALCFVHNLPPSKLVPKIKIME